MHIVSASDDCTIRIWNTATGKCEAELKGHSDRVNSAVFSSNGMHIVSACNDHTTRMWNTATGECETELKGHLDCIKSAVFSSDGVFVHTAFDGQLHVSSQLSSLDIYKDTIFHTISLQNIRVPPPFQKPSAIEYHLSKICLGYTSGEILLLEFQS
ncbi:WD40 repeat-like protein [Phlegmacium glaucopus]|nr:WD40 repeat-like protein [Phlegmacium glaucopus]